MKQRFVIASMLGTLRQNVRALSTPAGARCALVRPAWFLAAAGFVAVCGLAQGQATYVRQAGEYSLSGPVVGDQVQASVALGASGGILVWEDNSTDGDGSGLSYRILDSSFSGTLSSSRVNAAAQGNQGNPDVALLSDGRAAIVWEGGPAGFEDIFVRFLSASNTWQTGDILVNTYTNEPQEDPAVAALDNGESVIVWSSYNQAGATSMKDVYLQRFSSTGQPLGATLRVNQTSTLNQRTPAVARLSDGRFVVAWISESQYFSNGTNEMYHVDVFARFYTSTAVAQGNEFQLNSTANVCANPTVAAAANGAFLAAWSQKDNAAVSNSWDIACRSFASDGTGGGQSLLNSHRYGDQFRPSAAALGSDYFVVWTSLAQDGSHEGVFGRFVGANGQPSGGELQVNTTSVSQQILPDLASDGGVRFLAVWSGFTGISAGFDIFGQRYATDIEPLMPPDPPYVWALRDTELKVSWPGLAGFAIDRYEIFVNGAAAASATTTNNWWNATGLTANTTYSFRLGYTLADGRSSPLSAPASGRTYGASGVLTYFFDAVVPADWLLQHWPGGWPDVNSDSDGDGASNKSEFLAGTDPLDPASVLRTRLVPTSQGFFLHWNTEPGKIYQVYRSTDFAQWNEVGGPRFAPGEVDSLNVGSGGSGLFRVVLLRN